MLKVNYKAYSYINGKKVYSSYSFGIFDITVKPLDELSVNDYTHILKNNIKCAEYHGIKPILIEKYSCILKYTSNTKLIIYGSIPDYLDPDKVINEDLFNSYQIGRNADCLLDSSGQIIKNKWGYTDY